MLKVILKQTLEILIGAIAAIVVVMLMFVGVTALGTGTAGSMTLELGSANITGWLAPVILALGAGVLLLLLHLIQKYLWPAEAAKSGLKRNSAKPAWIIVAVILGLGVIGCIALAVYAALSI